MKHLAPHHWGIFYLITLFLVGWMSVQIRSSWASETTVTVMDIGQGDAVLIQTPEHKNILIDAGPDGELIYELDQRLGFFNRKIDLFILTHPHRDHFMGGLDLLDKYPVGAVMLTGIASEDPLYLNWIRQLRSRGIPLLFPHHKQDWQIGKGLILDFLYPLEDQGLMGLRVKQPNNLSLAFLLKKTGGTPLMLFMGDAEAKQEREMLFSGQALHAPVLKVAHHGSKSSTTPLFLEAATPQMAVISSGTANRFKHPHGEILERLHARGIKLYRTDLNGTVTFRFR